MADSRDDDIYADSDLEREEQDESVLSPTDGYFNATAFTDDSLVPPPADHSSSSRHPASSNIPRVPNVLVEDPTLSQASRTKEQEAEGERLGNSGSERDTVAGSVASLDALQQSQQSQRTPPQSTDDGNSSNIQQQSLHEVSLLATPNIIQASFQNESSTIQRSAIDPAPAPAPAILPYRGYDAPPAYSAPRSQTLQTLQTPRLDTSNTLYTDQSEVDERSLLLPRSSTTEVYTESLTEPFEASRAYNMQRRRLWSTKCLNIILLLLIAVLIAVLVSLLVIQPGLLHDGDFELDQSPIRPHDPELPPLQWKPMEGCRNTPERLSASRYNFKAQRVRKIAIEQGTGRDTQGPVKVKLYGELVIQVSTHPQENLIDLLFETVRNDDRLKAVVETEGSGYADRFELTTSATTDFSWDLSRGAPCIQGRITVSVPPGSLIKSMIIAMETFGIQLRNGLHMGALSEIGILALSGNISFPMLSNITESILPYTLQSPDVSISSGDHISGWFPWYERVQIGNKAGVDVQLGLKPALKGRSQTADLEIIAAGEGGNIRVTSPLVSSTGGAKRQGMIPARDYVSVLRAVRGNVTARLPTTSSSLISAPAGHLDVELLPVFNDNHKGSRFLPRISTWANGGNSNVVVNEPLWWYNLDEGGRSRDSIGMRDIRSSHVNTNGNLDLIYPRSWSGHTTCHSVNSSVSFKGGNDFRIIRTTSGRVMDVLEAVQGTGYSDMGLEVVSGTARISLVGELQRGSN